jgi:hypothetical protein
MAARATPSLPNATSTATAANRSAMMCCAVAWSTSHGATPAADALESRREGHKIASYSTIADTGPASGPIASTAHPSERSLIADSRIR